MTEAFDYNRDRDMPPSRLTPSGISFDTTVPEERGVLRRSFPQVVPAADDIAPHAYDTPQTDVYPSIGHELAPGALSDAMDRLHPTLREAVEATFGLTTGYPLLRSEAGALLGAHPSTVSKRRREALQILRQHLGVSEPEPAPNLEEQEAERPPQAAESTVVPTPEDLTVQQSPNAAAATSLPFPGQAAPSPPVAASAERPTSPRLPTAIFAPDVDNVTFSAVNFARALRAEGVSEDQIARLRVLFFASRTAANYVVAGMGSGEEQLDLIPRGCTALHWGQKNALAVRTGPYLDAQLTYLTRRWLDYVISGRLPVQPPNWLTARQYAAALGVGTGVGAALGEGGLLVLDGSPTSTLSLSVGAACVAGFAVAAGAAISPLRRARKAEQRLRQFGPFVTVDRHTPKTQ